MKFARRLTKLAALILVSAMILAVSASAACLGVGTVNVDALRMRETASTESEILLTAAAGDRVLLLETSEQADGMWYKVNCNLTEGWMRSEYLDVSQNMDCELGTAVVNVTLLNFRKSPSTDAAVIGSLAEGAQLKVVGLENGWLKVEYEGQTGYISGEYVNFVSAPSQNTFAVTLSEIGEGISDIILTEASSVAQALLTYASTLMGCPYVYGGTDPSGFDCSGFVQYVFKHFGISVGRSSDDQYEDGIRVDEANLQAGDLLFWTSSDTATTTHSGIYIGNRQFIHASSNDGITITSMDSLWYSMRYVGAVRILGVPGYEPK